MQSPKWSESLSNHCILVWRISQEESPRSLSKGGNALCKQVHQALLTTAEKREPIKGPGTGEQVHEGWCTLRAGSVPLFFDMQIFL